MPSGEKKRTTSPAINQSAISTPTTMATTTTAHTIITSSSSTSSSHRARVWERISHNNTAAITQVHTISTSRYRGASSSASAGGPGAPSDTAGEEPEPTGLLRQYRGRWYTPPLLRANTFPTTLPRDITIRAYSTARQAAAAAAGISQPVLVKKKQHQRLRSMPGIGEPPSMNKKAVSGRTTWTLRPRMSKFLWMPEGGDRWKCWHPVAEGARCPSSVHISIMSLRIK